MARTPTIRCFLLLGTLVGCLLSGLVGCGSTKSRLATEQLLVSDAVDNAIATIDFRSLAGENVYFDTRYLINVKGVGFVNAEYIISSLRQQMIAADVRLKEKIDEADYVVEARVGTLGSDGNEIIYGIPANKGAAMASTVLPSAAALPALPEISVARKESQLGAVKVAAFAYDRRNGTPIWQSGIARSRTTSQDVWLFGAGPFQRGSIHARTEFAGGEIRLPGRARGNEPEQGPPVAIDEEFYFPRQPVEGVASRGKVPGTAVSAPTKEPAPAKETAKPTAPAPPQPPSGVSPASANIPAPAAAAPAAASPQPTLPRGPAQLPPGPANQWPLVPDNGSLFPAMR